MKKICFVMPHHILDNQGGGAEVQAWLLAKELAQRNLNVSYIAQKKDKKLSRAQMFDGVKIIRIKNVRFFSPLSSWHYYKSLRNEKPDIIIQRGSISQISCAAGIYARKSGAKFVWICSDNSSPFKWANLRNQFFAIKNANSLAARAIVIVRLINSVFLDILRLYSMRKVSVAFTQNDFQKRILRAEFGMESQRIICGHEFHDNPIISQEKLSRSIILWVGNLGIRKRPQKFIELARLAEKDNFKFIMIGTKEDESYIKNLFNNIPSNLEWLGRLSFEQTSEWFRQATFLVNTSQAEGFPNVYVQAWLAGTPVVALEADPDGIIQKNRLGFVEGNLSRILDMFRYYKENPSEYDVLSRNVRKYAETNHSVENLVNGFIKGIPDLKNEITRHSIELASMRKELPKTSVFIKFAIILRSLKLMPWEVAFLKKVLEDSSFHLSYILILNKNWERKSLDYRIKKIIFYFLYEYFRLHKFSRKIDHFLLSRKPKIIYLLPDVKQAFPIVSENTHLEKIRKANLDFIIALSGFDNLPDAIYDLARNGIFMASIEKKQFCSLPAFLEYSKNIRIIELSLVRIARDKKDRSIESSGIMPIYKNSYLETVNEIYVQIARWIKAMFSAEANRSVSSTAANKGCFFYQSERIPTSLEIFTGFLKSFFRKVTAYLRGSLFYEQWTIGYIDKPVSKFLDDKKKYRINWLLHPKRNEFFADPFPLKFYDKLFIFFENYNSQIKKGKISFIEISREKEREVRDVYLEEWQRGHLSFPCVFEDRGIRYLLVEQWRTSELILYVEESFPHKWKRFATVLKNAKVADPIMFSFGGLWWVFFTRVDENPNLNLYVCHSDKLSGPWISHRKNPVKTDATSSRCAGRIFRYKNILVRPAQNCGEGYGVSIVLNKIIKLSPDDFEEDKLCEIKPDRVNIFSNGMHTFNPVEDIIVVDGKRYRFSPGKVIRRFFS